MKKTNPTETLLNATIESITQTESRWKISAQQEKTFNEESILNLLSSLKRVAGEKFYVMDHYKRKIIVSSSSSSILCGHPKELLETEGFSFFERILHPEELAWLLDANKASYSIFFYTPLSHRKKLTFSYELTFITADGEECILYHKITPYQLCSNGNLWLSFCSVTESRQKKSKHAILTNHQNGDKYKFVNGEYEKKAPIVLTKEEQKIVRWLAKGFTVEYMASELNISCDSVKKKRRKLYEKTDTESPSEIIHWAHTEGVI